MIAATAQQFKPVIWATLFLRYDAGGMRHSLSLLWATNLILLVAKQTLACELALYIVVSAGAHVYFASHLQDQRTSGDSRFRLYVGS
jgi:hypothetical protein